MRRSAAILCFVSALLGAFLAIWIKEASSVVDQAAAQSQGVKRPYDSSPSTEPAPQRTEPIAPIEQAHRTITVAHLGNIAMMLGRKVRWNPVTERFVDDPQADRMRDRALREPWAL